MTKVEIEQRIEMLEQRLFLIDMIDRWESEDAKLYADICDEINELKKDLEKLDNLPKENHD